MLADGYKIDGAHFTVPLQRHAARSGRAAAPPAADRHDPGPGLRGHRPTNGTHDEPGRAGLAGFVGHITDYLGEVTTDVYGNPLCTTYEGEDPVTHEIPLRQPRRGHAARTHPRRGGNCVSDANGILTIPHLGTNRYALSVTPPDGQTWIQTTTLEGNHDWDAWVMEGSTGFDTEFVLAGEPFPSPSSASSPPTATEPRPRRQPGTIKGVVDGVKTYTPPKGGLAVDSGAACRRQDRPSDRQALALAGRPAGRRHRRLGRPGQRRRHLRHHERARRQLHADAGGTSRRTTSST